MLTRHLTLLLALLSAMTLGCDDVDQGDTNGKGGADGGCQAPSGECFRLGWVVSGARLTAELLEAEPTSPVKGSNAWTVALTDDAGESLTGCAIHLVPYMPDHGHGSNEVDSEELEATPGRYLLEGFELSMPGYWQLKSEVSCPGLEPDDLTFDLWLES